MAFHSPRLWWVVLALLIWSPHAHSREFTHEDIREAMLSLVHMIRLSEDKLERHEYREKSLGEQLKKMLVGLDKKHRALEPLKGMISRMDERLSNVETILLMKEDREKTSQKKTNEALEAIQKSLQALTNTVEEKLKPVAAPPSVENNLTTNDDTMERRLDATDAKIDSLKKEIENLKNNLSKDALRSMCLEVASDYNPLEKHISEAEKLLNKYELKLNEYNGNITKVQTDFVPLNEVSLADEAWHSKMTEVMERQEKEIKKIQRLLSDAEGMWKDLPTLADLHRASNRTLDALGAAMVDIKNTEEQAITKIKKKIREMGDRLVTTNEDIQRSLTQSNTMTELAYNNISNSYESLRTEAQAITNSGAIIVQTADNVLATKKRVEYSVHQILMGVSDLINKQNDSINKTLSVRFDNIEAIIADNQLASLVNLSSKIEIEMAQVWQQIGIMHKQLTASKESLDNLTEQTGKYVNSSTTTMLKVKDEVGAISTRIMELTDNLNYVLGRLSLTTQQFSQISVGLNEAMNKISGVSTPKPKDNGPGPHQISSAEIST